MRYRRRVQKLEKQQIGIPGSFWLQHINLNTTIHLLIFEPMETTESIMKALQLFPFISGRIVENGNGHVQICVPHHSAIDTFSTMRETIIEMGLNAYISINPAWRTLTDLITPLNSSNYDFINGKWKWGPQTLS